MKKIHLDLKVIGEIQNAYSYSSPEISRFSGANLGNLVFRHALRFILEDFGDYTQADNAEVRDIARSGGIASVIISCANWLGTREQDERANKGRADLIASIDAPVIPIGIGVQASQDAHVVELGPEAKRLARTLGAKCNVMSVRDEITWQTLRSIGVKNTVITGCPSNFINLNPNLGLQVSEKARALVDMKVGWRNIRTCVSEIAGTHGRSAEILASKMRIFGNFPAFYVVQSRMLLPFLMRESHCIPPIYEKRDGPANEDVVNLLKTKCLHFSSVDAWLDFCRTCDFAFGMRIHGNMVPLQAGVPSLLIAHDSRTSGLAKTMGIPTITPDAYLDLRPPDVLHLLEYVVDSMSKYDAIRRKTAACMHEFLSANAMKSSDALRALARK